jgi:ATP-dependent Lhr-like helicase
LTEWAATFTQQLLTRHGVVTREVASIEQLPGGFSAIYPVLRRMEDTGRVRRGYFVAGLGAAQFAQPGAIDLLRAAREAGDEPYVVTLAATDPANPYGALLPWPAAQNDAPADAAVRASRSAGARVILVDGHMTAWIGRGDRIMLISLPMDDPDRSRVGRALAHELVALAHRAPEGARGWLIEEVNGDRAANDPAAAFLLEAGFTVTAMGLQYRVARRAPHNA